MAKGAIISQIIADNTFSLVHGFSRPVRRVIVDGMAITSTNGAVYVFPWLDGVDAGGVEVIQEDVDVPDDLVESARVYMLLKDAIATAMHALGCSDEAEASRGTAALNLYRQNA